MNPGMEREFTRVVALGCSAGGVAALSVVLGALPPDFGAPVLMVQHIHSSDGGALAQHLDQLTPLEVVEPCDKARILPGRVYVAPANYHMLVEREGTISLSTEERVNWSRPSIDVLFISAARAWGPDLIAIVLSGANSDGAQGLQAVKEAGGLTLAQDPEEAEYAIMPRATIAAGAADRVMPISEMATFLCGIISKKEDRSPLGLPRGKVGHEP